MSNTIDKKIPYPVIRVPASQWDLLLKKNFPNSGPNPSVYGMRKMYWGFDAPLVRCCNHVFKVDMATYNWMRYYAK